MNRQPFGEQKDDGNPEHRGKIPATELTVQYSGRNYRVIRQTGQEIPYELHGARGARYYLVRNQHNPSLLFSISISGGRHHKTMWFTDAGGTLIPRT